MVKYLDIVRDLKEKIESDYYPSWSTLEGEVHLADYYKTSRMTIRKALNMLKDQGYIHTRQGSGIYVNPPEFYQENLLLTLSDRYGGPKLDTQVLHFEEIVGNKELCEQFHVPKKSNFIHYKRLRLIDAEPVAIEETWMPKILVPELTREHLSESIMSYIEKNYHVSHDYKQISAIKLNAYNAELLNKKKYALALAVHHHVYLLRSILIQYTIEIIKDNKLNALSIRGK